MTRKFIGYHVDENDGTPISVGETYDEAMFLAIQRVLGIGATYGSISIGQRELSDEDWDSLKAVLDEFAAKHGLKQ